MDKTHLKESLPDLNPNHLKELKYIGVDEVARAKGHDYMTVIYDIEKGYLIDVETGRTAEVFSAFLKKKSLQISQRMSKWLLWICGLLVKSQ